MNRIEAERKAMELYPKLYPGTNGSILNAIHRAAFMQCFDLRPTGSLPMTREDVNNWIDNKVYYSYTMDEERENGYRDGANDLYDHLASLSSAAPAPVGVTKEAEVLQKVVDFPLTNVEDQYDDGWNDGVNAVKCMVENEIAQGTAPVSSAAQPATGYSEAQVREAIRFATSSNPDGIGGFTPDEIISSLNKKP